LGNRDAIHQRDRSATTIVGSAARCSPRPRAMATGHRTGRLAPGRRAPLARSQPVTLAASPRRASAPTRANAGRPLSRTRSTARPPCPLRALVR